MSRDNVNETDLEGSTSAEVAYLDPADILNDALEFLGGNRVVEEEIISYGDLTLTVAAKEGKANTLLADHLFSPALFLAERIERGLLRAPNLNVIELGAGCALPSLLFSTIPAPPATVVVTDYPDPAILTNLASNVQRNARLVPPGCAVHCCPHEWGADVAPLLQHAKDGYDLVILSDLLHFHTSHPALLASVTALLAPGPRARIHVAAGKYTPRPVCDDFMRLAASAGLLFTEVETEPEWLGTRAVSGLTEADLAARKRACRYWVGSWVI